MDVDIWLLGQNSCIIKHIILQSSPGNTEEVILYAQNLTGIIETTEDLLFNRMGDYMSVRLTNSLSEMLKIYT